MCKRKLLYGLTDFFLGKQSKVLKIYLMLMKRRECMIYIIILLYLIRCCVNFVLAQAVHSGAHVLRLDSRPVDISVALAVQTCVREQKS